MGEISFVLNEACLEASKVKMKVVRKMSYRAQIISKKKQTQKTENELINLLLRHKNTIVTVNEHPNAIFSKQLPFQVSLGEINYGRTIYRSKHVNHRRIIICEHIWFDRKGMEQVCS